MKVLCTGRRSGKTTRVVRWLLGNPKRIMAVATMQEKKQLLQWHPIPAEQIYTFEELRKTGGLAWDTEVVLDNADRILQDLVRYQVVAITLSTDDSLDSVASSLSNREGNQTEESEID